MKNNVNTINQSTVIAFGAGLLAMYFYNKKTGKKEEKPTEEPLASLSVSPSSAGMGSISVSGVNGLGNTATGASTGVEVGRRITVTATPSAGFEFVGWRNAGTTGRYLSQNARYLFNMPENNVDLVADFRAIARTFDVHVQTHVI